MNKTTSFTRKLHVIFYVIILIQTGAIVFLFATLKNHVEDDRAGNNSLREQIDHIYDEIEYSNTLKSPILLADQNRLAIPEMRISLPYNEVTSTLRYNYDGTYLRVGSTLATDRQIRQMSCTELVLVTYGDGSALNPWTESAGSVKLSDNSTINLIKMLALERLEASTADCASDVWTMITPDDIVEQFKQAQPY